MRYAILTADLQSVREVREYDSLPAHKAGRVLPIEVDAQPAYNAATQKLVQGAYVIEASSVRQTWTVVALSAAELEAISDATESSNLVALWNDWDNITANQQKRVLKRIFKDFLKTRGLI